ncbi:hypothetical protein [Desulfovibrio sp.]|uniref:hypothetical protein n=1 Tax=Desulfovibrio sp. TaxID=885 RepID=UPI0030774602
MAEIIKTKILDADKNVIHSETSADIVMLNGGGNVEDKIKSLESAFASGINLRGTVGSGGTVETLPADSYKLGDMYVVLTDGTYASQVCEPGDLILCVKAYAEEGAADTDWTVVQNNVVRAVKGPESATDGNLMAFDGVSGTVAKDSTLKTADVSDAVAKKHEHANSTLLDGISADGNTVTINGKKFYAGRPVAIIENGGEIPADMAEGGIVFEKAAV